MPQETVSWNINKKKTLFLKCELIKIKFYDRMCHKQTIITTIEFAHLISLLISCNNKW